MGPPQILLNGAPLAIRRRKAQALLIYLAVMGGPQPREVLASLLADAAIDDLARKHLRTALSELSTQIGDYLLCTRHSIALNRDLPRWLDIEQFTAMLDSNDPAVLERAVALYEDAFLTGFVLRGAPRFEAWMLQEQEHLNALLVKALHRLLDQALQSGDVARAISVSQRLIDEEPWCEETHRQLMWLLARTGRRSEALDQYAICRRIVTQNLNSELQPETQALLTRLRAGAMPVPHNLPALSSPIIGRERELAMLLYQLAASSSPLITLLGLGGCGKTRLALEAAHRLTAPESGVEHSFSDGVYLVDLSAIEPHKHSRGAETVATTSLVKAIGRTLGVRFTSPADPAAQLLAHLHDRSLLLILDGCESLLAGTAVLSRLLQGAPNVTFLATSRAALGLVDERVMTLEGLALPTGTEDLEEAAASQFFLHQAQRTRLNKPLCAADRAHVVRICRLTHGHPLALMLAANWLSVLSCAGIAAELAGGIDLLMATDYDVPERQRSLRAIFDTVWKELTVSQQTALRQLAIFQGSFTVAAVQSVAGTSSMLPALSERMLLDHDECDRYTMHGLVRLYAAERLAARPEDAAQAQARHASYYAALVHHHDCTAGRTPGARVDLGEDIDNVRSAWDWAIAHRKIDLLEQMRVGLAQWYYQMDLFATWIAMLEQAAVSVRVTLAEDSTPNPVLQQLLAYLLLCEAEALLLWQGHGVRAWGLLQEVRVLARAARVLRLETHAVSYQAWLLHRQGKVHARVLAEQAVGMARVARAQDLEAYGLWLLGACTSELGEYPLAHRFLGQALSIFAAIGDRQGATVVEFQQGVIAYEQGDFATARSYIQQGLPFWRAQKNRPAEQMAVYYLGLLCDAAIGRHLEAQTYLAQAVALAQQLGDLHSESMARVGLGQNALLQGDFQRAQAEFEHALSTCREIERQTVLAQALCGLGLRAHYLGDHLRAQELARQALLLAQETGQRRVARFAHRVLAQALQSEAPTEAAIAYQQALELDQELGYSHFALEDTADLANTAVALGDLEQAAAYATPVLAQLEDHSLCGVENPVQVYLTCYHVLKAIDDPRAWPVLRAGFDLLQDRAAQFTSNETRSRYLENIPAHREIACLARMLLEPAAIGRATAVGARVSQG
jgi:DNA-binding SARP family transcriptional activator/predicted ATPase